LKHQIIEYQTLVCSLNSFISFKF